MGQRKPAYLCREIINVVPIGSERKEKLSTGEYTLINVECRFCGNLLGWKYLSAEMDDQKYKEGTFLLEQSKLTDKKVK